MNPDTNELERLAQRARDLERLTGAIIDTVSRMLPGVPDTAVASVTTIAGVVLAVSAGMDRDEYMRAVSTTWDELEADR